MTEAAPLAVPTAEAARLLGVGQSTLERYRLEGRGPRYTRVGGKRIVYRMVDLERYLEQCVE